MLYQIQNIYFETKKHEQFDPINTEIAQSRTRDIFIRDTAYFVVVLWTMTI